MDFNFLPAPYVNELNKVYEIAKTTRDDQKRRFAFNKFSRTFTAIPSFWYYWLMAERTGKFIVQEDAAFVNTLRKTALTNFFNNEFLTEMGVKQDGTIYDRYPDTKRAYQKVFSLPYFCDDGYKSFEDRKAYLELIGSYLTFPHQHIQAVFDIYKEISDTFISTNVKQIYEKNLNFYQKLNKVFEEKNVQEWFTLLLDTQDEDVIIQNMEYFISKRPESRSAWKLYIFYLFMNDKEEILSVYSRYCRFFVTDLRMINQYFKEILSQQKSGNNCIRFIADLLELLSFNKSYETQLLKSLTQKELNNYKKLLDKISSYETNLSFMKNLPYSNVWFVGKDFPKNYYKIPRREPSKLENIMDYDVSKKCVLKWNVTNLRGQRFPFCSTIIRHISSNVFCRQKLYQTCKFFFAMNDTPISYGLRILEENCHGMKYVGNVIEISKDFFNQQVTSPKGGSLKFTSFLSNTVVTTVLNINNSTNRNCYTRLMDLKDDIIHIRYLTLAFQDLSLKDINLIKKDLISVKFTNVNIFVIDNHFAAVEDVVAAFSGVKYLELNCETLIYTEDTARIISFLPREIKFSRFAIFWVPDFFGLNYLHIFLERNTVPNCHLCIEYHPNFKDLFQHELRDILAKFTSPSNPDGHSLVIADH